MNQTDPAAPERQEARPSAAPDGVTHADMANAIRALAMDAVQQANSGHPGMPMGTADIATVLFTQFLRFDPRHPEWPNRDRFVLSAGHGSMLLYALHYLLGYEDVTEDEIRAFRQLGSKTPGHPEYGHTRGVETTTGPLGQGFATAVGMALAERMLASRFGEDIVDHHTYVIASDGDLMEGISHEAASLAGHLGLSKLIVLYDDNEISIDGPTHLTLSDDALGRFRALGWDADAVDGHDPEAIAAAIRAAQRSDAPSLIACRTQIGYGSPNKAGTAGVHGAALGAEEVELTRKALGWSAEPFDVPTGIKDAWRIAGLRSAKTRVAWEKQFAALSADERAEFERRNLGRLPAHLDRAFAEVKKDFLALGKGQATRKSSGQVLDRIASALPELIGGSADLTGSNLTKAGTQKIISTSDYGGTFIHYGVREHAMGAIMNGLALHGGFIPYSGTFLVFSDYCRPAMRLAALMGKRVVYVMTHDSIGVGEDGPTHQPVEHLAALRAIPNMLVFRPADAVETAECWEIALSNDTGPSVIALTRQDVAPARTEERDDNPTARGAYILSPASLDPKVVLLATGSEIEVALAAQKLLEAEKIPTRVVSVPCQELFWQQDADYRRSVLGEDTVKVAIEAAIRQSWDRFIGPDGGFVGMIGFGASAPYKDLYRYFGITPDAVVQEAKARL